MRRPTIFELLNKQPKISGTKVKLRPRALKDAENEFRWRKDEELCRLDASLPMQYKFYEFLERYLLELEYPGLTFTFSIDTKQDKHIGNCSLFNLTYPDNCAEIGIIIGEKEYWDKGYGSDALCTFMRYIFKSSNTTKLVLKTLDWNTRAQKCFEKCGFTPCGNLARGEYYFVLMEIYRQQFLKQD